MSTNHKLTKAIQGIDSEACRRSAHHFIFGKHAGDRFLVTKDEHDSNNPVKPFKDELYIRTLLDAFLVSGHVLKPDQAEHALAYGVPLEWLEFIDHSGVFFLEKSRQIMATWLACAYMLWRAKYFPHQLIIVQSKREEDAANLVFNKDPHTARISFMETHLPSHLKTLNFPRAGSYCHLYFPNGSHIWGIPEGGDIIRSNSASVIFSDEAAFQAEFGNAYAAALPAVKGVGGTKGQLIAVSSAEMGEFADLVEWDQITV